MSATGHMPVWHKPISLIVGTRKAAGMIGPFGKTIVSLLAINLSIGTVFMSRFPARLLEG
ncbi:hypothetical protein MU1_09680 [Paenibacillus glycanilyticus]|uniref:Uncharacterized protein n=1 Tax=Paenibacillus glycanilyticus TaxID=126569 RepID=A0ABQ6G6K7_9BACL|nr:hypothetical protein MU1_09680 [Paenibacillus glycanilyticus]